MPTSSPRILLGFRLMALLELALFFALLWFVDQTFSDGSRFAAISPHPAWIAVLLMALQYGTMEALLAALAATAFLYVGNIPAFTFGETRFDYYVRVAWLPLSWLATAFVIGEMRVRQRQEMAQLQEKHAALEERAETITAAYGRLKDVKESLEIRLASQRVHTHDTVQAMNALSYVEQSELLPAFAEVITAATTIEKFSLFEPSHGGARRIAWRGWSHDKEYSSGYDANHPLIERVLRRQQVVSVLNREDEFVLENDGLVALPVIHPYTRETLGILRVEEMPFVDFSESTVELLVQLCDWFGGLLAARFDAAATLVPSRVLAAE